MERKRKERKNIGRTRSAFSYCDRDHIGARLSRSTQSERKNHTELIRESQSQKSQRKECWMDRRKREVSFENPDVRYVSSI